jgi:hypothetical protein
MAGARLRLHAAVAGGVASDSFPHSRREVATVEGVPTLPPPLHRHADSLAASTRVAASLANRRPRPKRRIFFRPAPVPQPPRLRRLAARGPLRKQWAVG